MPLIKKKEIPPMVIIFSVLFFLITICLFSYWGYEWVNYLLSKMFNVSTSKNMFDLFIGLIAMASSVLIFTGGFLVLQMRSKSSKFIFFGSIGFLIKNILEIANAVFGLFSVAEVTKGAIERASWTIGLELFQIGFWVFVLIYFMRRSFKAQLSEA